MNNKSNLPVLLQDEVESFFDVVPPGRLARNLSRLLLTHIAMDNEACGMNEQDLYVDLIWLFELLYTAEDELGKPLNSKREIPNSNDQIPNSKG